MNESNDAELDAVTGGGIVHTVIGVATQIWKIITTPAPSGVKGRVRGSGSPANKLIVKNQAKSRTDFQRPAAGQPW